MEDVDSIEELLKELSPSRSSCGGNFPDERWPQQGRGHRADKEEQSETNRSVALGQWRAIYSSRPWSHQMTRSTPMCGTPARCSRRRDKWFYGILLSWPEDGNSRLEVLSQARNKSHSSWIRERTMVFTINQQKDARMTSICLT